MRLRVLRQGLASVLAFVVVVLLLGQLLGQPLLLSFVSSGSMEPTMETGDGFITIPTALSGDISQGDIIVFRAETVGGGGLTTHRVVGETERGYITKGDANPFTDQSGGEPIVTDGQVVATAFQLNGHAVTIPKLGTSVLAVRNGLQTIQTSITSSLGLATDTSTSLGTILSGLGVVLFGASYMQELRDSTKQRSRSRKTRDGSSISGVYVILFLLVVVSLPANITMLSPSGLSQVTVGGGDQLSGGEQFDGEVTLKNGGLVSMTIFLTSQSDDMSVSPNHITLPPGQSTEVRVSGTTPPPGEEQVFVLKESYYLRLLPVGILKPLYGVHPLLTLASVNVVIVGSIVMLVAGTIGFGRRRFRETDRDTSILLTVRRALRRR